MASRPIPTILIVLISFAAGWAMSRYFSATATGAPADSAETQAQAPDSKAAEASAPAQAAAPVVMASQPPAQPHSTAPAIPTGPNQVVDPNRNVARGDPSKREFEEHLLDQIRDRFPEARMIVRKTNPDGTYNSKENLDDGGTVSRSFNSQGQLVGESWKQAGGDELIRTYYDGGGIKGFSEHYENGSITNISFTQAGLFKGRSDDYPDGTHVYTNYDDQGQILDRWSKGKDGKTVRIQ